MSSAKAHAKLRLLYEVAPIALLVEAAGGRSSVDPAMCADGKPMSVLDLEVPFQPRNPCALLNIAQTLAGNGPRPARGRVLRWRG